MEPDPKEKGQRRKLKRVVQKKRKSKINLNNSASVAYYKKVKAALNTSLNTSRASQTLKANNKALAQSLQHAKQDLRRTLNENGRLKVENQELTIKLLRLENQIGDAPEQASYEQRLQGVKAVLNNMSRHLLDLGNCVSDGMHLCLVSPRTSQTSTSRPQSMEEFKVSENDEPRTTAPLSADLNDLTSECEMDSLLNEWEGELSADGSNPNALSKMTPDMSIIMEQSVLVDPEEVMAPSDACMSTVLEDPLESGRSQSSSKNGSKKVSALTKLPQRVRNGGGAKSSNCEKNSSSPEIGSNMKTAKTRSGSQRVDDKKSAGCSDGIFAGKAFATKSPPPPRKETSVANKSVDRVSSIAKEVPSTGSLEDIASIPMPDLVSASPMKDVEAREVFETDGSEQTSPQKAQAVNLPVSPSEESTSENKLAVTEPPSGTTCKEKRKSAGKKTNSAPAKQSKGSAVKTNRVMPTNSKKDADFFVSNPCALNLVHKRVTGSSEGCLDASKESTEQLQSVGSVDQFMAQIKESNKKSSKLASFLVVEDFNATQKSCKSAEIPANIKSRRSSGRNIEPQSEDQTVYFDTDMEFTQVLPRSKNLVIVDEDLVEAGTTKAQIEDSKAQLRNGRKEELGKVYNKKAVRSKPGHKDTSSKMQTTEKDTEEDDKVGTDKKLAVALRVNKPGQIVFAASRKEEDGTRKAIPAKLQTKARSKSKKQVEEMVKNLPQQESECIFDFHDRTPRPAGAEGKSGQQHTSVFDLSLNDTVPGIAPSLANIREKLKTIGNNANGSESISGAEERKEDGFIDGGKTAPSNLLGDAPVYSVPLKDNSNEPEPRPRSRGRSSSRSKDSSRQSRSRSRSRNKEVQEDENIDPGKQSRPSRSRSRGRTLQERADDASKEETEKAHKGGTENSECDDSSKRNSEPMQTVVISSDSSQNPRRSARSRSRTHKKYSEDDVSSPIPSPKEKNTARGRSRSRVKKNDDDEDYEPPNRSQPRGRSRHRQADKQPTTSDTNPEKPLQNRGRSRSRRRVQEDQSHKNEDEIQINTVPANQDNVQESHSGSASNELSVHPSHRSQDKMIDGLDDEKADKEKSEKETGTVEMNESDREPLKLITDRRQRSKSSSRKLYSETDLFDDPFGPSADVDKTDSDSQPASLLEKQRRHRTRSRGTRLINQENEDENLSKDLSEDSHSSNAEACSLQKSKRNERVSDKRKVAAGHSEAEREVSPSKRLCKDKKNVCDSEQVQETSMQAAEKDKDDSLIEKQKVHAKDKSTVAANSPLFKKRRKSSLPVAVFHAEEEDKSKKSSAAVKSKSKPVSKIPEPKSAEKEEKMNYQLEFEDLKRKLKDIDHPESTGDMSVLPVKKSRPLVLPKSNSTAEASSKKPLARSLPYTDGEQVKKNKAAGRSKKARSQPGSPKVKKDAKVQPDNSPVVNTPASAASSATCSPQLSETHTSRLQPENADESSADGKRGRRAAAAVCYKEPSLNAKLRRGDPHTTFLHKEQMTHIYKSPKMQRKHGKSDRVVRAALHDLTNQSIQEVDGDDGGSGMRHLTGAE